MTSPGFRRGRPGGARHSSSEGAEGFLSSSLFSQAQILHLMKNEFARARRHGIPVGCLLLQVDRLAQLVDLHGAELRSEVRLGIARLVREKTRGSDLLGANNDDRYLLLLPHTNLVQSRIVADRLLQLFDSLDIAVDGRPLALTMSIGLTSCEDQTTLFFDSLLAQAEAALDHAARSGGSQVMSFGEMQLRAGAADPRSSPRRRSTDAAGESQS